LSKTEQHIKHVLKNDVIFFVRNDLKQNFSK